MGYSMTDSTCMAIYPGMHEHAVFYGKYCMHMTQSSHRNAHLPATGIFYECLTNLKRFKMISQ